MGILTINEEIILIAIYQMGGEAYGVLIRDKVIELSHKNIVYGTLYNSLDHLIRKGYVSAAKGDPTPERGGKRKTIYSITSQGKSALYETRALQEKLWKNMPDLGFETKGKTE